MAGSGAAIDGTEALSVYVCADRRPRVGDISPVLILYLGGSATGICIDKLYKNYF